MGRLSCSRASAAEGFGELGGDAGRYPFLVQQEGTNALHVAHAEFAFIAPSPGFPLPPHRLLPPCSQPEATDSSLPRKEANGVTQQEPAALLPAW